MPQRDHRTGSRAALERALAAAKRQGYSELTVEDGRDGLRRTVRAARNRDTDVVVSLHGLSGDTLAAHARAVCDLAIELGVPLEFEHRGRTLQLTARQGGDQMRTAARAGPTPPTRRRR